MNRTLTLQRIYNGDDCTLGILYDEGMHIICCSLEEPDNGNKPNISCIPDGTYTVTPHTSMKYPAGTYEINNIYGRSGILIHAGNTTDDIEGCVLLGLNFGRLKNKKAVLSSQIALNRLNGIIGKNNSFTIKISRI